MFQFCWLLVGHPWRPPASVGMHSESPNKQVTSIKAPRGFQRESTRQRNAVYYMMKFTAFQLDFPHALKWIYGENNEICIPLSQMTREFSQIRNRRIILFIIVLFCFLNCDGIFWGLERVLEFDRETTCGGRYDNFLRKSNISTSKQANISCY